MNPPLRKLSAIVMVMFLTLMVAVTYIQFFKAPDLNADARNVRTLYREYGTDRGPIIVAGNAITTSEPVDDPYKYQRTYVNGPDYAHVTGYFSTVYNSMTGLERAENGVLGGSDSSLVTQRLQELITGKQPQGGAIALTIDPDAQAAAIKALGNRKGAVVAIDPKTGAILALVSTPSFDPNLLAAHDSATATTAWTELNADPAKPLYNRAIAGDLYAPGSSFKILTAAAMLENGLTADSLVEAPTELKLPGTSHIVHNPGERACGDGSGNVPFRQAFLESCNTAFAIGGMELGDEKMMDMAEAFGFGQELSIPLKVTPSQFPKPANQAALAMDSFGQQDIRVTPLQMAMVAAAISNDGELMKPYLVAQTLTADLEVISTTEPSSLGSPISSKTAKELEKMMADVVNKGTGTYAALGNVQVVGKTGSAEIGVGVEPHAWFVGYETENRVAVAVFVENGGDGGQQAGPIAGKVIDAVVNK